MCINISWNLVCVLIFLGILCGVLIFLGILCGVLILLGILCVH